MSKSKSRLVMGMYVGDIIRVGEVVLKLHEFRGKQQVKIVVEAPPDLKIERLNYGQKARNPL